MLHPLVYSNLHFSTREGDAQHYLWCGQYRGESSIPLARLNYHFETMIHDAYCQKKATAYVMLKIMGQEYFHFVISREVSHRDFQIQMPNYELILANGSM